MTICPAFDRLTDTDHARLAPTFSASSYLTDAVEKELTAAGIPHDRADFTYAPSFEGVQQAIQGGAVKHAGNFVLAEAINHMPSDRIMSCDFKLYSEHGELLFEKRCLCMNYSTERDWLFTPHMVMQQLFADPNFQRVIQ
jgi:hypothetical protein